MPGSKQMSVTKERVAETTVWETIAVLTEKPAGDGRRSYSPPSLVDYGKIQDLTQGSSGALSDFGTSKNS